MSYLIIISMGLTSFLRPIGKQKVSGELFYQKGTFCRSRPEKWNQKPAPIFTRDRKGLFSSVFFSNIIFWLLIVVGLCVS